MGKHSNPRRRSMSLAVLLLTVSACCGLPGHAAAEVGRGAGLQTSDTFEVGERISTILRRLDTGAGVAQAAAETVDAQQSSSSLAGARGGLGRLGVAEAVEAQQSLWSTTLTAESFELTGDDDTLRLVGYLWLSDFNQRGALGDSDFDLLGTTHYVRGLFLDRDNWTVWFIIDPPPDLQDVRSMTLTVDGQALAVSDSPYVEEDDVLGAVVVWPDHGFRWSDGQRIAAQLTTGQDGGGANQAPRAIGSVPAQTLTAGGGSVSVNVAPYFTDPDGDALTYTARSSRTGVVTAAASGSTATLAAVAAGSATVTVTARDPGGLSATQSIAVTVEGDGGTASADRAALEALYDATGGASWTDDTNWKTSAPLGDWYGVTTDVSGRVTRLELGDNGLAGSIPSVLGDLDNLEWLDLGSNELGGSIPGALGNLANLVVLELSWNELSGSVPGWLGNMPSLLVLVLFGNELTGGIPEELENLNLLGLGLSWNDLTVGSLPAWLRNHTNLRWVYLSGSGVTGGIPAWLGNLVNLESLSLSANDLTGPIPSTLGNLVNLERLDLGYNWGVTGSLPSGLRGAGLEDLDVLVTQACAPRAWQEWLATIDFLGRLCGTGTDVEIDVAVVYTPAARDAAGGVAAIEAEIDLMVAETNQAYETSGVNHRLLLVGRSEVPYAETGDPSLELDRLGNPLDGHLDDVHALRDRVGADLVHLIVSDAGDICGKANLPGPFGLTLQGCGGVIFAHELGHNMGLRHDRYQVQENEGGVAAHPAFGYVNQRTFEPGAVPSSRWFTVMSYPTQCDDADLFCSPVLGFSNPRLQIDGDPFGIPYGTAGSGVTGAADASAVLNTTGPAVALWRDRILTRANRPPTVVGSLPDQSLTLGQRLGVDVSAPFADPDGDTLTYRVSSSSPNVVTAALAGRSTVTLTAVGLGTATIQVTATDPGGLSAMLSFAVAVSSSGNLPPEPVGTLPPVAIQADGAAVTVDVAGAFRDPDGDRLTYGASSSRLAVAAVSVSGSRVTVTPRGPGSTMVTVTATDVGGSNRTATQSFGVTVLQPFTDDPIVPGETPVRAIHFTELRARIDRLRVAAGLVRFVWTDPVLRAGATRVRLVHLTELRSALAEAYAAAGRPVPRWTDTAAVGGTIPIRAAHVTELRAAVVALE